MKAVVFDSGTLINLSMNGLLPLLQTLKDNFEGKFLITESVKYETIDRPLGVLRFELGALQIQNLFEKKVIELPESINISSSSIRAQAARLTQIANHYLQARGRWIPLVSDGEMSCLALSDALSTAGIENIIAIDERTTRMLAENPSNLQALMSEKLHQNVISKAEDLGVFSHYKFIRSSELVFVAYKKGLVPLKGKNVLQALLYATKFKGSSISFEEIEELKRL